MNSGIKGQKDKAKLNSLYERNSKLETLNSIKRHSVTTHVVRLKGFRLKAEDVKKSRLMHLGVNKAEFHTKHGVPVNVIFDKTSCIFVFPKSLQSSA